MYRGREIRTMHSRPLKSQPFLKYVPNNKNYHNKDDKVMEIVWIKRLWRWQNLKLQYLDRQDELDKYFSQTISILDTHEHHNHPPLSNGGFSIFNLVLCQKTTFSKLDGADGSDWGKIDNLTESQIISLKITSDLTHMLGKVEKNVADTALSWFGNYVFPRVTRQSSAPTDSLLNLTRRCRWCHSPGSAYVWK